MTSYREKLWFETEGRRAYLNITPKVEAALKKSGVKVGLCLVNAMHITASVYINDDEPGLIEDYDEFLERLAPHAPTDRYHHMREGDVGYLSYFSLQGGPARLLVGRPAGRAWQPGRSSMSWLGAWSAGQPSLTPGAGWSSSAAWLRLWPGTALFSSPGPFCRTTSTSRFHLLGRTRAVAVARAMRHLLIDFAMTPSSHQAGQETSPRVRRVRTRR